MKSKWVWKTNSTTDQIGYLLEQWNRNGITWKRDDPKPGFYSIEDLKKMNLFGYYLKEDND